MFNRKSFDVSERTISKNRISLKPNRSASFYKCFNFNSGFQFNSVC